MNVVFQVALGVLALTAVACVARLLRPSSLPDRIVALDVLVLAVITGVAVETGRTGDGVFADLLVVASLLGFVGTVVAARFVEDRGV